MVDSRRTGLASAALRRLADAAIGVERAPLKRSEEGVVAGRESAGGPVATACGHSVALEEVAGTPRRLLALQVAARALSRARLLAIAAAWRAFETLTAPDGGPDGPIFGLPDDGIVGPGPARGRPPENGLRSGPSQLLRREARTEASVGLTALASGEMVAHACQTACALYVAAAVVSRRQKEGSSHAATDADRLEVVWLKWVPSLDGEAVQRLATCVASFFERPG